jgi:hypothetical protein
MSCTPTLAPGEAVWACSGCGGGNWGRAAVVIAKCPSGRAFGLSGSCRLAVGARRGCGSWPRASLPWLARGVSRVFSVHCASQLRAHPSSTRLKKRHRRFPKNLSSCRHRLLLHPFLVFVLQARSNTSTDIGTSQQPERWYSVS